ncbi:MAG TPA: hypothetical protein P5260_19180 [Candidatus Competibacter sp.]|nr:hypothetical protein [Candidatus Competibacter sp.]
MGILNTLSFLLSHPLGQGRKLQILRRYFGWQIGARHGWCLVRWSANLPTVVTCWFDRATGATGNVYVGLHEFEDMAFVLHFLRAGKLFVDIGANVGSYTMLATACVKARCIAFEPGANGFAWLERNVRL